MTDATSGHYNPAAGSAGAAAASTREARSVFVAGLQNAHAMEKQALSIMNPQLKRIENYPAVAARVREHIAETEAQVSRLEQILDGLGENPSGLKDAALSTVGSIGALSHAMAGDEILKNSMADYAFEHFEIAAYKSLIMLAERVGETEWLPLLELSLAEEQAMADWLDQNLETVTLEYVSRRELGETAKR